ncbi:MAG: hypothetical protein DRJ03_03500 [Chloroflexi bacterium]|nr:MAG: hypothetical protein DRJ03_03500 [Chloroflexota bacterium]
MAIVLRKKATADLTSAALAQTFEFQYDVELVAVLLHASEAITETVSVTFDSKDGANYDTLLDSTDLTAETDYVFRPTEPQVFQKGDKVSAACTNANTTGSVYLTVLVRSLHA